MNRRVEKLLAIETTDGQGSIAFMQNGRLVLERTLPSEQRSARSLAPAIRAALNELNWSPREIDCVGVAIGPGSFTGLRIGIAAAKMFAWSVDASLIGVESLFAIASGIPSQDDDFSVSVGMDAQRGDVARRTFLIPKNSTNAPRPLEPQFQIQSAKDWLNDEKEIDRSKLLYCENNAENQNELKFDLLSHTENIDSKVDRYFCGPALTRFKNSVPESTRNRFVAEQYWFPSATLVAQVAWNRQLQNDFDDLWTTTPIYSRKSAAEEKLETKIINQPPLSEIKISRIRKR